MARHLFKSAHDGECRVWMTRWKRIGLALAFCPSWPWGVAFVDYLVPLGLVSGKCEKARYLTLVLLVLSVTLYIREKEAKA